MESEIPASVTEAMSTSNETEAAPEQGAITQDGMANPADGQEQATPEHIPYAEYKTVNDQLQELSQKYQTYEQNKAMYDSYAGFDQVLMQNPELLQIIQEKLAEINGPGQQGQEQAQQQQPNTAQQLAYDTYLGEFDRFAQTEQVPAELKDTVLNLVKGFLLQRNPDPLNNYNMGTLKQALQDTKNLMDHIWKTKQASYIGEKKQTEVPATASKNGAAPTAGAAVLSSYEDRTRAAENIFKMAS